MLFRVALLCGLNVAAVCQDHFITIQLPSNAPDMLMTFSEYYLNAWSKDRLCKRMDSSNRIECPDLDLPPSMTFAELRDRYQKDWNRTRSVRGHQDLIPETLVEFQKNVPYLTWDRLIIPTSAIKQAKRFIYRSPENAPEVISVAIAENSSEVEIAIKAPTGNYEFYVYGPDGRLSDHSKFPAGQRPAPTVCAACHGDSASGTITRFLPQR